MGLSAFKEVILKGLLLTGAEDGGQPQSRSPAASI